MEEQIPLVWIILGAYVLPGALGIANYISTHKKDRHKEHIDDDSLSLEWSKEFMKRLTDVEDESKALRTELIVVQKEKLCLEHEINKLKLLNADQTARIIKLENERAGLITEIASLRDRIRELEDENKRLKES